ncbi:OmpA family protein [Cesiribacter andamanensis]|uniref:Inner membrane lipoprotein YiaD n=1 Tax=Cesiribacter andamanensis AMV16 TaxID=1279009 RepID=M7NQL9_9BACT|nr:OmpA family protein [Cesiribacter andamanensis]EMR00779.1 Inner membrane lipoprotein YiaD precursor [Cesiribacter andamanensis AMV16]
MKKFLILLLMASLPLSLAAQINVGNRIKSKVNQRANQKVDKAIDKALDSAEGKESKDPKNASSRGEADEGTPPEEGATATATPRKPAITSYSKFDFVPGTKVLFYDDLMSSRIGEFPDFWLTNGMGQTVRLDELPGQWLQLSKSSRYAPDKRFALPADYTVEFDLIMLGPEGHSLGQVDIRLVQLEEADKNPMAAWRFAETKATLNMGFNYSSFSITDNQSKVHNSFNNNVLYENRGTPMHVAIAVNGTRYRMWINEKKVFDIPQLLEKGAGRNMIFLDSHLAKEDPEYQVYLSNFRVAEGRPDMRKALAADGKFVTHGITFDSGSDKIKPESYGLIREIAAVLQEDPSLRIRIIGHTDSDGAAATNLDLSRRRAQAIKTALATEYSIAENRLETDGKGATLPIDSNDTAEGKANNRRAEFIKL